MTSLSTQARSRDARLTVDESRIPDRLWHAVDLDGLRTRLQGNADRVAVSASLAGASLGLSAHRETLTGADAPVPLVLRKRLKRVPDEAFVTIGRVAAEPAATANDNLPLRPSRERIRFALRDALMLAALALSLAGAFYSGRLHAAQNVIVVPTASSMHNVVT